MDSQVCERCGQPATVSAGSISANRDGVIQASREHCYCRECARAAGVPKRARDPAAPPTDDGLPPDWEVMQRFYEMVERVSLANPAQRAKVAAEAADDLRFMDRMPDKPPATLRALLERLARGTA
jgi:hypothetical protein